MSQINLINIKQFVIAMTFIVHLIDRLHADSRCGRGTSQIECRSLRDCGPFMTLIDGLPKPLNPTVVQFLRSQQCGFDAAGFPMVCCRTSMPKELRRVTTNRTTTTTTAAATTTTASTMPSTTLTTTKSTEATTLSTQQMNDDDVKNKKFPDQFNRMFMEDLFEYDLFRRRRGLKSRKSKVDIEIR